MLPTASPARRSEKDRDVALDGVTRLSGERSDRGVDVCDDNEDPGERRLQMGQADALKEEREVLDVLQSPEKGLEGASLPEVRAAVRQRRAGQSSLRPLPQRHREDFPNSFTPPVFTVR